MRVHGVELLDDLLDTLLIGEVDFLEWLSS
jgi:hypothetical protein